MSQHRGRRGPPSPARPSAITAKERSQSQLVLRRFLRHRLAVGQPACVFLLIVAVRLRRPRCSGTTTTPYITPELRPAVARSTRSAPTAPATTCFAQVHARHPAVAQDRAARRARGHRLSARSGARSRASTAAGLDSRDDAVRRPGPHHAAARGRRCAGRATSGGASWSRGAHPRAAFRLGRTSPGWSAASCCPCGSRSSSRPPGAGRDRRADHLPAPAAQRARRRSSCNATLAVAAAHPGRDRAVLPRLRRPAARTPRSAC